MSERHDWISETRCKCGAVFPASEDMDAHIAQANGLDYPPTCIITGEPGEDADDCTTHDHEGDSEGETVRPRLDVVHAPNMRPGDWYTGQVNRDAVTRPVHDFAAAFHVAGVETFTNSEGRRMVRVITTDASTPDPVPIGTQVLVIRGV